MKAKRTIIILLLAALCVSLLGSCAAHGVRGEPPFVQINSLNLQEQTLTLDMGIRNVNSEAIFIEHIEFSIMLGDSSLAIYNASAQASVIANGTENLRFNLSASTEGADLLNDLKQGNRASLEYTLDGVFLANDNVKMKVARTGHIYPVPGKPGHFR